MIVLQVSVNFNTLEKKPENAMSDLSFNEEIEENISDNENICSAIPQLF